MKLITKNIEKKVLITILTALKENNYMQAVESLPIALDAMYNKIPDKKRISYGRVYTIRTLTDYLYRQILENDLPLFNTARIIFNNSPEHRCIGVGLGLFAAAGIRDFSKVLTYFETAADHENWEVREFAQMYFRKIIKAHPEKSQEYLLKKASSKKPNIRRFVAETLRPVQENRWMHKVPDYSLMVLAKLFKEPHIYVRTAVGNNLSDLARRNPDMIYKLVKILVYSRDKYSFWIAYRACRNLVKHDPLRVMDVLDVNEYKYKNRRYLRIHYEGD